jgi:LacI family transcriptional regulator
MTTILDVARSAGVSPGTVSNVLTGKRPVSPSTRDRVLAAVESLGYEPNILARSLINRRSDTIAVVAAGLEFYGPSRTLVGIEREADRLGYSLLLEIVPWSDGVAPEAIVSALSGRQVDGIIWAVPEIGSNRAWLDSSRLSRLPPLVFLSMAPRPGINVVAADNRRGAVDAALHLQATDRRYIGHIAGPPEWWEASQRRSGWEEVIADIAASNVPRMLAVGDWSALSGERAMRILLEQEPRIDAVFAANDQMALGALRALHRAGRHVPDDVAVVGFDDIPESAYFLPALTTVRQDLLGIGGAAVGMLHRTIGGRRTGGLAPAQAVELKTPELIVRESSGARGISEGR